MASKMFKVTTHGTQLDASTVSQAKKRFSQIMILENQLNQTAGTW